MISSNVDALASFLLNISRTIDNRFQIPSGSRPLRGLSNVCHSVAAGGALFARKFTSLKENKIEMFKKMIKKLHTATAVNLNFFQMPYSSYFTLKVFTVVWTVEA